MKLETRFADKLPSVTVEELNEALARESESKRWSTCEIDRLTLALEQRDEVIENLNLVIKTLRRRVESLEGV